jgi:hypothetical protein
MPRMTNTYMLAGQHDPQEMIRSVKKGLYAVNFGGGQVDITSGKYVFSATEAYLIEDGKVTAPVKGATLIGNGPETMQKVRMIGHDLALDEGVGVCGKDGQSVPVGVGQPSLLIDGLTVGGTARVPGMGIGKRESLEPCAAAMTMPVRSAAASGAAACTESLSRPMPSNAVPRASGTAPQSRSSGSVSSASRSAASSPESRVPSSESAPSTSSRSSRNSSR